MLQQYVHVWCHSDCLKAWKVNLHNEIGFLFYLLVIVIVQYTRSSYSSERIHDANLFVMLIEPLWVRRYRGVSNEYQFFFLRYKIFE